MNGVPRNDPVRRRPGMRIPSPGPEPALLIVTASAVAVGGVL